jgi:Mg2+/Co2+ transporter CorC
MPILLFTCICREAIGKILARGHSRVPVYSGNPRNVIGLLLVGANDEMVHYRVLSCMYFAN